MTKTRTKAKTKKPAKPYWEMTTDELAEATKEFDGPIDPSQWRPMNKAERAKFERMQKEGSRSIYIRRRNVKQVTIQLDAELLKQCSDYASKRDLSLSDVISLSLQSSFVFLR